MLAYNAIELWNGLCQTEGQLKGTMIISSFGLVALSAGLTLTLPKTYNTGTDDIKERDNAAEWLIEFALAIREEDKQNELQL